MQGGTTPFAGEEDAQLAEADIPSIVLHPEHVTETDAHLKCRALLDAGTTPSQVQAPCYSPLLPAPLIKSAAKP